MLCDLMLLLSLSPAHYPLHFLFLCVLQAVALLLPDRCWH